MKLYKNKKEIGLYDALYCMKTIVNYNFEYMVSQGDKLITFGKIWIEDIATKKLKPQYWIHQKDQRIFLFENEDMFLVKLLTNDIFAQSTNSKTFCVWEEIK